MGWKAYRLVYQAKSPIHIGWHTLGYIKLTRYYITGRNMWGAITANLTKALGSVSINDYKRFGDLLKKEILISYFYPALGYNNNHHLMLPKYTEEGLRYGDFSGDFSFSKENFESLFISSFGQTAVLPESNTAEDESLHESEYIQPAIYRNGNQEKVYFVGYIFISEEAEKKKLAYDTIKSALGELFVGGDRKYGWGRIALFNNPEEEGAQRKLFGFDFISNEECPVITIPHEANIPAHLIILNKLRLKGDIEPLIGREWSTAENNNGNEKRGAGQKISDTKICWMPGSVMGEKTTLKIGEFGLLIP